MNPSYSEALSRKEKSAARRSARAEKAKGLWGKRAKKKKSPSLSKLKKLLWTEISLLVRSWSETCLVPGCGELTQCAAHIVPANDGAATRFFLPNLYPCCFPHNEAERRQRGSWVYKHRAMFGDDFVDALYAFSETTFQVKKHWVLEQTGRMRALRNSSRPGDGVNNLLTSREKTVTMGI